MTNPRRMQMAAAGAAGDGANLWAWGENTYGSIGNGLAVSTSSPVNVEGATWSSISKCTFFNKGVLGIQDDGSLWAIGGPGYYGHLGLGNEVHVSSPTQIGSSINWTQVTSGKNFTMAINSSKQLFTWGRGDNGRQGRSDTARTSSPIQVGTATDWEYIACTSEAGFGIRTGGTLWSWGQASSGVLGNGGSASVHFSSPVQIGSLTTWSKVSGCHDRAFAIKTDGTLWGWGGNNEGRLGDGTTIYRSSPVQMGVSTLWTSVHGSVHGSFGITSDGKAWTWGPVTKGTIGQLGEGPFSVPTQLGSLTDWGKVLGAGRYTVFAIKTDGTLWGMGDNNFDNLLQGTPFVNVSSPVQIGSDTDWVSGAGHGRGISMLK